MLKISRLADYGSVVMRYLAYFIDQPKSAAEVAEGTHIALPTVRKILKLLQNADLLISTRGQIGGYQLARSPDQISLVDIIEAIDGPIALTQCNLDLGSSKKSCGHTKICTMKQDWQLINQIIKEALSQKSLGQLCAGIHPGDYLTGSYLKRVSNV